MTFMGQVDRKTYMLRRWTNISIDQILCACRETSGEAYSNVTK